MGRRGGTAQGVEDNLVPGHGADGKARRVGDDLASLTLIEGNNEMAPSVVEDGDLRICALKQAPFLSHQEQLVVLPALRPSDHLLEGVAGTGEFLPSNRAGMADGLTEVFITKLEPAQPILVENVRDSFERAPTRPADCELHISSFGRGPSRTTHELQNGILPNGRPTKDGHAMSQSAGEL